MSKESTQPVPPGSTEKEAPLVSLPEQVPLAALPPESDPSGFTERAPALVSLLPDEALSQALARGDALGLHGALSARLEREPPGPLRGTLRELLDNRSLFTVAERPPRIAGFLGTGLQWVGLPAAEAQQTPFIATRALRFLGVPLWPLGEHLVQRSRDGQLQVLGRVAVGTSSLSTRRVGFAALGALALAAAGAALAPFVVRDVQIANGFSRPVEVTLNGEHLSVEPGQILHHEVYGFGSPYFVSARWPGAEKPFEALEVESNQRTLYNILGAAVLDWGPLGEPASQAALPDRVYSVPEEGVELKGGWEVQVRADLARGLEPAAASLAKAVFMADPSQLQAGREAARILVRTQPQEALWFARELPQTFPDDPAVAQLAQDIFIALDQRAVAFSLYEPLAKALPGSVGRALMAARVAPPEQVRDAYTRVREHFSDSPEALRALARLRLADGYPNDALALLKEALIRGPESLEDLELRVRTLVAADEHRAASAAVKQFHSEPRHASFELAVLAGRLARIAGPGRTQYVARDMIPPVFAHSPESMAAFTLLTGDSTVSDGELSSVVNPEAREALWLTRAVIKDFEGAVKRALTTSDPVLSRLDPETAALLGLELSRRGEKEAAGRVFGSSLTLLAARAPLQAYVSSGAVRPEFFLLPPGLQAAAYVIHARGFDENLLVDRAYARWADGLGGMARQAFGIKEPEPKMWRDPKYEFREKPRWAHVYINLRDYNKPPPPPEPVRTPAPERTGERLPRPWPETWR